jgi:hypothetical protein
LPADFALLFSSFFSLPAVHANLTAPFAGFAPITLHRQSHVPRRFAFRLQHVVFDQRQSKRAAANLTTSMRHG